MRRSLQGLAFRSGMMLTATALLSLNACNGDGPLRIDPEEIQPEATSSLAAPPGGALAGNRYRVIIASDIGGADADDYQSMVHYLLYADLFDTEGLISSPPLTGRKQHILDVIDAYETDYPNLRSHSSRFPTADELRAVTKQGAIDPAPSAGYGSPTEGSQWIVQQARRSDSRPLYILVWGSITDVAQAVHDDPGIKSKLRIYSVGSWNTEQDRAARNYLYNNHPDLWWIETDQTFRGMYVGGNQSGDLGNVSFIEQHVKGHGALGAFIYSTKRDLKAGDTPSVLYLLTGDPSDPEGESWGGSFVRTSGGRNYWTDSQDPADSDGGFPGAKTVNRWREAYLRDWQARQDWAREAKSGSTPPPVATRILTPASGTTFSPGQVVNARGEGESLQWAVAVSGDPGGDFATGTGTAFSFTVPSSAASGQTVVLKLSGSGGTVQEQYAVVATQSPPATTRLSDLLGHWKLDEGTGSQAGDASPHRLNGTVVAASWTSGRLGGALDFSGSGSQYVDLGNPALLRLTGEMTLSAWVYVDGFGNSGRVVAKQGGSGQGGWSLHVEPGGIAVFEIASGPSTLVTVRSQPLPANEWVLLTGTYKPGRALKLFVNGRLSTKNNRSIPAVQYDSGLDVNIGRSASCCGWQGRIDDVRIYGRALTGKEVKSLAAEARN